MRHPLEEAFMVEGVEIVPRLMQALEPPAIELAGEGFVLALPKVSGYNLSNEEFLVVSLPCPTMRLNGTRRDENTHHTHHGQVMTERQESERYL